jgi:hypothetical protein
MMPVYCGYSWRASPRFGRKEDQQGDGKYPQEVQRFQTSSLDIVYFAELENPADGNLDGYQKKKYACLLQQQSVLTITFPRYVAKIIFTYILGYKVDVGHMEAVNLISSAKYSEKQIVRCFNIA